MDCADAPIRYRTARELLHDAKTAKTMESDLLACPAVSLWLDNLKPDLSGGRRFAEHGSFDDCLENALLKAVQLGLHGGLPPVLDAVSHYVAMMEQYAQLPLKRRSFPAILTANLLSLAGAADEATRQFMLASLNEMHSFIREQGYRLYLDDAMRAKLTGIPTCWKDRKHFIRQEILDGYGFAYPLIYDIAGLHTLYSLQDPEVDAKIDNVLRYILTDEFHSTVADGYGILAEGNGVYHGMGWDPKCPGWLNVREVLESGHAAKLLFYAQYAARYPAARETRWFRELLECLATLQTEPGRYAFPAKWFTERQGYAVMGSHLSYGENRRKKNWAEIEATFYMQLLSRDAGLS